METEVHYIWKTSKAGCAKMEKYLSVIYELPKSAKGQNKEFCYKIFPWDIKTWWSG